MLAPSSNANGAAPTLPESVPEGTALVLFDGVCNFCNSSVNFIIDRDPRAYFRFAPLQSALGRQLREQQGVEAAADAIVLIEAGKVYLASTAALRIARRLSGLWPCLYVFIVVPRLLRDGLYDWFARHRYSWFGRSEHCRVPTPDLRSRFIASEVSEDSVS